MDTNASDSTVPRTAGPGRRRDPAIDARLRHAAREIYAREGWAGFHFDGVARLAGVSKDAVYRRYPDAKALLMDAISEQTMPVLAADMSIEPALIAYAVDIFTFFAGGSGNVNLRVHIDGEQYPGILQRYREVVVEPQLRIAVDILERARRSGDVHPDTSPEAVIEALGGAVMMHALAAGPRLTDGGVADPDALRHLTALTQQILHGHLIAAARADSDLQ